MGQNEYGSYAVNEIKKGVFIFLEFFIDSVILLEKMSVEIFL
jgi:hypothetical protein